MIANWGCNFIRMRILIIWFSLFYITAALQLQINDDCKTPTGLDGVCKPVSECDIIQPIVKLASRRNQTALELAIKYQCGYQHQGDLYLVCCELLSQDAIFTTPKPRILQPVQLGDLNSPDLPDRSICGKSHQQGDRIWGGEETDLDEFPWTAAIEYKKKSNGEEVGVRCGGSLINQRYVLTAAHCIRHKEFKAFRVRLGEWDLTEDPDCYKLDLANEECADKVQTFIVKKELPHRYYSVQDSSNDIGLLKLDRNVSYSKYIRPICLPPEGLPAVKMGTYMTVVGWGVTEDYEFSLVEKASDTKRKVTVPLVSNGVCKNKILRPISSNHYCAGGESGKDACRGDSGGPLMRVFQNAPTDPEQWFLEGIVGSGLGCGLGGTPAIYIRVTEYVTWIINTLSEERRINETVEKPDDNIVTPFFINLRNNR